MAAYKTLLLGAFAALSLSACGGKKHGDKTGPQTLTDTLNQQLKYQRAVEDFAKNNPDFIFNYEADTLKNLVFITNPNTSKAIIDPKYPFQAKEIIRGDSTVYDEFDVIKIWNDKNNNGKLDYMTEFQGTSYQIYTRDSINNAFFHSVIMCDDEMGHAKSITVDNKSHDIDMEDIKFKPIFYKLEKLSGDDLQEALEPYKNPSFGVKPKPE